MRGAVDGVYAFGHPHGCSQLGEDLEGTRRLLAALACHPNAGGVLILGLGCESNQLDALIAEIPETLRGRVRTLKAQGEGDEVAAGLAACRRAGRDRGALQPPGRGPCPSSSSG